MPNKKTREEYIEHVNKVHNNFYDYSIFEYLGSKIKGSIKCPKHGVFVQRADLHSLGSGCPKCSWNYAKSNNKVIEEFVEIHGYKYDYSKFNYVNNKTKSVIICPIHGEFEQNSYNHIKGKGCPKCGVLQSSKSRSKHKETFIKEGNLIHNSFYNYNNVKYVNWKTNVEIICPKHGSFFQSPHNHIKGSGCYKCSLSGKVSKAEIEVFEFVKTLTKEKVLQSDRQLIKPKELDIYIPDLNVAIEFNGKYWHSDKFKDENHRKIKTLLCDKKCVKLLHIEEEDWKNHKNMIKDKIKNLINNAKADV